MKFVEKISRLLVTAVVLCGGAAFADSLPTADFACSQLTTLADYESSVGWNSGNTCYVTGISTNASGPVFTLGDFRFTPTGSGAATAADLTVSATFDGTFLNININGFNCNVNPATHSADNPGCFDTSAESQIAYRIEFVVDPAPILDFEDISLDPPYGRISGFQQYCLDPSAPTDCGGPIAGPVDFVNGNITNTLHIPLANPFTGLPLSTITTDTTIVLNPGGTTQSGFDGIQFAFHTTTVPEPGSLLLLASSLGLLAASAKRYRR